MSSSTLRPPATFPAGFLLGAATASHQVEGGNRWNDWWELEQAGRLPHRSEDACRHDELDERDLDLAQSLVNVIASRSTGAGSDRRRGEWQEAEVEHYARVIAALRRPGLEPVVTLHHFTNLVGFGTRAVGRRNCVSSSARWSSRWRRGSAKYVRFLVTVDELMVDVKHAPMSTATGRPAARSGRAAPRAAAHGRGHGGVSDSCHLLLDDGGLAQPYRTSCASVTVLPTGPQPSTRLVSNDARFRPLRQSAA